MTPGIRDLHEDPGDELHRVDPLAFGRIDVVVSRLGQVDDLVRAGGEVQPRLVARGQTISLWVNGAVTSEITVAVPRGHFGLEAEGWRIEFRDLKVKPLGRQIRQ